MVLDALSQVGIWFGAFSFSLELLLHFLQLVGKDLPPSFVTFCNNLLLLFQIAASELHIGLNRGAEQWRCLIAGRRVENQEAARQTATDPSVLTSPSGMLVSSCTLLSLCLAPMAPVESAHLAMAMYRLSCSVLATFFFPKLCWWIVYLGQQELARFFPWLIHPSDVQHCDAPHASLCDTL